MWAQFHIIGDPEIKAGPDGIWTPGFAIAWDDVRSCGFAEGAFKYKALDPRHLVASDDARVSLVVTRHTPDSNGRQIQVGYTLYSDHTDNLDDFMAAVHRYAPTADTRTGRSIADYVPDPRTQAALTRQWASEGRLTVSNRRGKDVLVFDAEGVHAGKQSVPWSQVVGLSAVTDIQKTSMNGVPTSTDYLHKLVIVTAGRDGRGKPVTVRPDYKSDYTPALEQLVPALLTIKPQLPIVDRRLSVR